MLCELTEHQQQQQRHKWIKNLEQQKENASEMRMMRENMQTRNEYVNLMML